MEGEVRVGSGRGWLGGRDVSKKEGKAVNGL